MVRVLNITTKPSQNSQLSNVQYKIANIKFKSDSVGKNTLKNKTNTTGSFVSVNSDQTIKKASRETILHVLGLSPLLFLSSDRIVTGCFGQ